MHFICPNIFQRAQLLLRTYKKLEARFTSQRDGLKSKIPEIETTLQAVEHIQATVRICPHRETFLSPTHTDTFVLHLNVKNGSAERECEYELSSGALGTATISDSGNVYLWIGVRMLIEANTRLSDH